MVLLISLHTNENIFDLTLNIELGHLKFFLSLFRLIDEIFALRDVILKRVVLIEDELIASIDNKFIRIDGNTHFLLSSGWFQEF